MLSASLDADQVKNLTIGGLVLLLVGGVLLGLLISALIGRVLVLVVVLLLGALLWTQRSTVQSRIKNCDSNVSFLGYHVSLSPAQIKACQELNQ